MEQIAKAIVAVGFCAVGLAGIYFEVEYAGWVLFIGILCAL